MFEGLWPHLAVLPSSSGGLPVYVPSVHRTFHPDEMDLTKGPTKCLVIPPLPVFHLGPQHSHCRSQCRRHALWQEIPLSPPELGTCNGIVVRVHRIVFGTRSPRGHRISCLGSLGATGDSFQTKEAQPQEAQDSSYRSQSEAGSKEGEGEHVEQINVSLGHKATRVMTRLMSAV